MYCSGVPFAGSEKVWGKDESTGKDSLYVASMFRGKSELSRPASKDLDKSQLVQ